VATLGIHSSRNSIILFGMGDDDRTEQLKLTSSITCTGRSPIRTYGVDDGPVRCYRGAEAIRRQGGIRCTGAEPLESHHTEIDVENLVLDLENPRFYHLKLKSKDRFTEAEIEKEILKDEGLPALIKAIRRSGVTDPIWVRDLGDGRYLVIEGNRRTVVLRQLRREGVKPPKGITYSKVKANVIPHDTSQVDVLLQKARLQTGKKDWGPFNEATVTYILRKDFLMEFEDIAAELQVSVSEVKQRLTDYDGFREYVASTKDDNPRRFAFFSDMPPKIREWTDEAEENKKAYFELICPTSGRQKIRSVATRGGLRDFAKILDDKEALEFFLSDPTATVEDALEVAKENDVYKDMPFIKRLPPLAQAMFALSDTQIEKLKQEAKIKTSIRSLQRACEHVLNKLG